MTPPLVLMDSASLYFRSYFALPESITAPDGTPVNAARGFLDTVARIITERGPSRLVACLDADWRPAFRVELLPSYKAHRLADEAKNIEEIPDTLTPQVPIILDLLAAAGIATAEADGYEADDVIGTLTALETDDPVEVITGDRDLFQVVRDEPSPARVVYVGKGWAKAEVLGPAELAARYGLPATDPGPGYADMATLRGDPSDGLPGVAGIGEKTAAKLITEYGSLHGLLTAAGDGRLSGTVTAKLVAAADYLAVAPTVVRVATDADVVMSTTDDDVPREPRHQADLDELAHQWGLESSVKRLTEAMATNPAYR
ncbi:MAG TPA: 5'-3' exonuclease [Pseudonocardiaceae bacterium]|nr:5'-3' exonuclease [Pseudonocardiaceae bacterium]